MRNDLFKWNALGFLLVLLIVTMLSGCKPKQSVTFLIPTLPPQPTYTTAPTYTALPTYTAMPTYTAAPQDATKVAERLMQPTYTMPAVSNRRSNEAVRENIAKPWITVTPYSVPTELAASAMDERYDCGGVMQISPIFSPPELVQTITGHFAVGSFLMMKVRITNMTSEPIGPLLDESFFVHASLYGRDVRFALDRYNSNYADSRWSAPNMESVIQTGSSIDTYLVFDVNSQSSNFELEFSPITEASGTSLCNVRFPLPAFK